jgi:hypothetical protein
VVLEQKLELPEGFSDRSRLECYTAFDQATAWPQITTRVLQREKDPVMRAQMLEPDFTDAELDFGSMAMRAGTAFALGEEAEGRTIRVGKQFIEIEGQPVLIEAVEFKQLEPLLAGLASVERADTSGLAIHSSRQVKRAKEQARLPQQHYRAFQNQKEIQLVSLPLNPPAVVLDYELLGSATNLVLKGGTTWFVSDLVNVTNLVIEGTAVIKVTNSPSAKIVVNGAVDCQTGPYRPAIFTSQYDTSVGESVGSGTLTNYPGALVINTSGKVLRDLRISHATNGVALGFSCGQISLTNVQFVKCHYPIDSAGEEDNSIILDNGLFFSSQYVIRGGEGLTVRGQQLTINRCGFVGYTGFGSTTGDLYLTNSLVVAATNGWGQFEGVLGSVTTNSTVYFTNDPGGIFQTVGAGSHYLATNSPYRNAGTTNLNTDLLGALKKQTTYPPVLITTNLTGNTVLAPQAARDTDLPDLGVHFNPLDFVVSARPVSASLVLTNGVALGVYGTSTGYGLGLNPGSLVSEGAPLALNRIVRYNTVQEQSTTNWSSSTVAPAVKVFSTAPTVRARFTGWSVPGGVGKHFACEVAYSTNVAAFSDCQFSGGELKVLPGSVGLTNCLWERVFLSLDDDAYYDSKWYLFNNLFYGGKLYYRAAAFTPVVQAYNNFFDRTTITKGPSSFNFTHDYNGYITNQNRLQPSPAAHDVVLSNMAYASGPLGDFYHGQNDLVGKGSWTAASRGLYHYTTQTNQTKEGTSWLDIGFHYVALTNGLPMDSDADGVPDYLEDTIGNGTFNVGDFSSWTNADSDGDKSATVWSINKAAISRTCRSSALRPFTKFCR